MLLGRVSLKDKKSFLRNSLPGTGRMRDKNINSGKVLLLKPWEDLEPLCRTSAHELVRLWPLMGLRCHDTAERTG